VAIHNELEALDQRATPGSAGQIGEARRIAREARTWSVQFDAEPEWEEFALATSALAASMADALEHPEAFSAADYDRAVERLRAAARALPHDRQER
jgi:ABC-type phosphate/phosphonate transport system substrate-binding protein